MNFDRGFKVLDAAVRAGRIPGGVLGTVTAEGTREVRATGHAQRVPVERPMTEETSFDLASLTKVIFTTERVLAHAREGRIDLDAPLTTLLPDLRQYHVDSAWERQLTFRQCLGHMTGLPAVWPIYTYGSDPETLRAYVLQKPWPRDANVYSCINFMLLAFALERLEGRKLSEMDPPAGFTFHPDPALTAATEHCHWRGRVLVGEVHDENCFALQGSGNAGLFGPVSAVLGFAESLLAREKTGDPHTRLLRKPLRPTRGHGWEIPYPEWSGGSNCSPDTIGHTGFTGTGLWIDFGRGQAWTLLTNRVHPSRHFDSGIFELRRAVSDALNGSEN